MIKTTIRGENSEVSRLQGVLSCYYLCDKTAKIKLDGSEKEVKIGLALEEKEEIIDGLIEQERRE